METQGKGVREAELAAALHLRQSQGARACDERLQPILLDYTRPLPIVSLTLDVNLHKCFEHDLPGLVKGFIEIEIKLIQT